MMIWMTMLACGFFAKPLLPQGDATRPDIVVVSVDTLRADHLSSYGHGRPTSPFFDRLAAEGTRFADARSASPWTLPAHTTMLTGQLPATHHVVDDAIKLDLATPVLPELAQAAGWKTGGFVATMYVSRLFGFERGFDRFEDFDIHSEKANLRGEVLAEDVVDAALAWWRKQAAGEPVFLFLHVYDVHYEYDPPGEYGTLFDRAPQADDPRYRNYFHFKKNPLSDAQFEHQRAQYDEAIRYVDDQFSRIDAAAREAGREIRWVITSDHGEEFGERGTWGHAHTLYSEQLHVPLIISGPGLPAGKVVVDTVGGHDVAPTVASWLGKSGALQADGIDLGEAMAGARLPPRPFLAETTRFKTNRLSLLEGGLRLEWDLKKGRRELFAPAADPAERKDLAKARPADVVRLQARVRELIGEPWVANQAGTVTTEDGWVLTTQRRRRLEVAKGDRFQILPYDAKVHFEPDEGAKAGPFQAVGGVRPGAGSGLSWQGKGEAVGVELDEATRKALEALGYIQTE
jgi:arylsulfatase